MQVTSIHVSLGGKVPTQKYGNIEMNFGWQADLAPEDNPEDATRELVNRIRAQVVETITPIVEAKVQTAMNAVKALPEAKQEKALREIGIVDWLGNLIPDIAFIANPNGDTDTENKTNGNGGSNADLRIERPARNEPGAGVPSDS